jgi:hypothetical protein
MAAWLDYLKSWNATLSRIEDILAKYARGSTARVPILNALMFEFGPKGKLSELIATLEKYVEVFVSFSGL